MKVVCIKQCRLNPSAPPINTIQMGEFKCEKKSHFEQHCSGDAHKKNEHKSSKQTLLNISCDNDFTQFCTDLCRAFTAANIPWNKVSCPEFKNFMDKYTGRHLSSESALKKKYLPKDYDMVIKQIRNSFGNNDIWISVDETTDRLGRCIAHLVIGKLSSEEAVRPFLLALKQLDKTKSNTISRFLNESLALLWPKGTEDKKVKWFVSDGTSYMIKTDTNLKCLNYLDVNGIISNVKTIFLKAPIRVDFYKNSLPNTPLPPEPVLIRWGTWIQAALFYADHFHVLKQVVMSLEATDAQCIKKAQEFLNKANVKNELLYIKTHFKIIADAIEQLETIGLKLNQSVEIVEKVYTSLKNTPGKVGEMAFQNVLYLLKKNPGYDFICSVNNVICGNGT
ncbi:hypothetical protein Zmor_021891 [Zophobas morio]|uniref:DUF659 domain-containing protein n=1 Tax=Zophobas morio TaxID=2755281 RepID=A0AA38I9Y6_9CUCU|nr:hypothetical protein Zmor_021891 [Zophobas morio]